MPRAQRSASTGTALQLLPPAIDLTGGKLAIEPGADISLILPGRPALGDLTIGSGAALDVGIDDPGNPETSNTSPDVLAQSIAIASGGTLSIDDGNGSLELTDNHVLSGSGTLDASLANSAGTVAPAGGLHLTGDFAQGANGTLALDLRSAGDRDSLEVDGAVTLSGTLRLVTGYSPAATAAPLVLSADMKPAGVFTTAAAALPAGRSWKPVYGAKGVSLAVAGAGGQAAIRALTAPALRPAIPVVGGQHPLLPGHVERRARDVLSAGCATASRSRTPARRSTAWAAPIAATGSPAASSRAPEASTPPPPARAPARVSGCTSAGRSSAPPAGCRSRSTAPPASSAAVARCACTSADARWPRATSP